MTDKNTDIAYDPKELYSPRGTNLSDKWPIDISPEDKRLTSNVVEEIVHGGNRERSK